MIIAGIMSGTSADGINVALVEIRDAAPLASSRSPRKGSEAPGAPFLARSLSLREKWGLSRHLKLLGHAECPYPRPVRAAILAAMNAERARVADLARLNFLLGELYAVAVRSTERRFKIKAALIGCHGQTLYHQGTPEVFLGEKIAATWQTGEAAVLAARLGVPVVSDFRPADVAAGGKGAPLVPYLDYLLFRDRKIGRIVQNIGGIANLTAIPAAAKSGDLLAFDTGPGNMVIDAVTHALFRRPFDRNGRIAASGEILAPVLDYFLRHEFFRARPPRTAGREEFGREFVREFLRRCGRARKPDIVATATALTAYSVAAAIEDFVLPRSPGFREMILSGGGARNSTLVTLLAEQLAPLGIHLRFADEFGLPSEAKEAVAFAVLAYETWHRRPSNVPSATGAGRAAILGKISYA
jgi:anhydro-N-acetylmuramic acid kinase